MKRKHFFFAPGPLILASGLLLLTSFLSWSAVAPDASGVGPLAVTSSEYKLPASFDDVPSNVSIFFLKVSSFQLALAAGNAS